MLYKIARTVLTSSLLFFALVTAAHAQETISPEKKALIKEMLVVTDMQKTIDMMEKAASEQLEKDEPRLIAERVNEIEGLTPQEREKMQRELAEDRARFHKRFNELLRQKMNLSEVLEQITSDIMDKYFTEDDLRSLIAFYKSPVGMKMLQIMPQMMVDIMVKTSEALRPKLDEIGKQMIEEEKKRSQSETDSPRRKN